MIITIDNLMQHPVHNPTPPERIAIGFDPGHAMRTVLLPFSPPGNIAALWITARWIETRLRDAGICAGSVAPFGEYLDGVIVAAVTDRSRGLNTLGAVMRDAHVNNLCEIGFFDPDEAIWRTVYPETPGRDFNRFFTDEQLERYQRENTDLRRFLEQINKDAQS